MLGGLCACHMSVQTGDQQGEGSNPEELQGTGATEQHDDAVSGLLALSQ